MTDERKVPDVIHVSTLRLFDIAKEDSRIQLKDWELLHLEECDECRSVKKTFDRQFTRMRQIDAA